MIRIIILRSVVDPMQPLACPVQGILRASAAGSSSKFSNELCYGLTDFGSAGLLQEVDALDLCFCLVQQAPAEDGKPSDADETRLAPDPELRDRAVFEPVGKIGDDGGHVRGRTV